MILKNLRVKPVCGALALNLYVKSQPLIRVVAEQRQGWRLEALAKVNLAFASKRVLAVPRVELDKRELEYEKKT